jgi:CTP:molybdopterin cytidylyltransferase MocA
VSHEKAVPSGATTSDVVAVLLAAGAGNRFQAIEHKLLARITPTGPTILEQALTRALDASLGPVLIITGALDEKELRTDPALARLLASDRIKVRHNPDWAAGQATSLQLAVTAAAALGADAVVIGLADQPFIDIIAWQQVAQGLGPITVATYDGRRGNPVKLHASVWGLLTTSGDEGARILMRERPNLVVEVPCPGSPADIDTVEDLHRWQNN